MTTAAIPFPTEAARYLSCAETAKLVRAALRAAFPACKFSVKSHTYSMGASINVRWTDGPTESRVKSIVSEASDFDSMQDMKVSRGAFRADGELLRSGADFIFTRRDMSDTHWETVAALVAAYYGVEVPPRERAGVAQVPAAGEYFSTLVHRATQDRTRYTFA